MNIINVLKRIFDHPLNKKRKFYAIFLFFFWQIRSRLFPTKVSYFKFCEKSLMLLKKGLTSASGNYYCGLHEEIEMLFVLHFLRKEDLFLDIGANIGAYTLLAASEVGASTISFEPVPETFQLLNLNLSKNNLLDKAILFNKGVGSQSEKLVFTTSLGAKNRVVTNKDSISETLEVDVISIDEFLPNIFPTAIKIDVEGFELQVLKGLLNTIKNKPPHIFIVECNDSGVHYGNLNVELINLLLKYDFNAYQYDPFIRKLTRFYVDLDQQMSPNIIFIRDIDFVTSRISEMRTFVINGTRV